jgi:hypothetical protein
MGAYRLDASVAMTGLMLVCWKMKVAEDVSVLLTILGIVISPNLKVALVLVTRSHVSSLLLPHAFQTPSFRSQINFTRDTDVILRLRISGVE